MPSASTFTPPEFGWGYPILSTGLIEPGRKDPLGRMIGGQEVAGVGPRMQRHADQ